MDIFTTQLTRFIPVPIKPANLKVKALLKGAEISKLTEDPDHLENHENYFVEKPTDNETNDKADKEQSKENEQEKKLAVQQVETTDEKSADANSETKSKKEVKHLDLYV